MKFRPTAEITFLYIFSSYVGIDQKLFACSPVPIDPQFQARIGRSIRPPNEARTGTENRNLMPTDVVGNLVPLYPWAGWNLLFSVPVQNNKITA